MINVAILIDDNNISSWQKKALEMASDLINVKLVLSCKNTSRKRKVFHHLFYYILNVVSLQNRMTKKNKLKVEDEVARLGWPTGRQAGLPAG